MRATGIVRRIDDLGRIVIPKEIRKVLKIREGEALEIFTAKDSEIVLKKYSPMGELISTSEEYAEALGEFLNAGIVITDRDCVLAVSASVKKNYVHRDISIDLEDVINNRKVILSQGKEIIPIIIRDELEYTAQTIYPLISVSGDCIGSICMVSNKTDEFSKEDEKVLKMAATLLGRQVQ